MGVGFSPTWLRQVSPLLHMTTLTTAPMYPFIGLESELIFDGDRSIDVKSLCDAHHLPILEGVWWKPNAVHESFSFSTPARLPSIFPMASNGFIMRPSSLRVGRILRRTLSVRLSVCLSVCPSVPLSLPSVTSFRQPLASRMYFSARTEGRISYGHLGRTDSCFS